MAGYRYTESGLDNVMIEGVNFLIEDAGEASISIPNINGLHKAIAGGIVRRPSGMTGRELRFLRTEIGHDSGATCGPSSPGAVGCEPLGA